MLKDIRAILLLKELGGEQGHHDERLRDLMLHRIHAEAEMMELSVSSKMNAEWAFLEHLHDIGWRAADTWLAAHRDDLGERSTYPLDHVLWDLDTVMRDAARSAVAPARRRGRAAKGDAA